MGKDHKRKRDSNSDNESEQPPKKNLILQNGSQNSEKPDTTKVVGARRQIRSERKKKRAVEAQQNARKRRDEKKQKVGSESMINKEVTQQDDIATGQDFVSLGMPPRAQAKAKRRSPRSIRKEARQKKLEEEVAEVENIKADGDGASGTRFICFVGNLPYAVTTEQIANHFSKIQPKSIRLSTDKQTGECRGYAFLEFEDYDRMKTCLKLYHHSEFHPGANGGAEGDANGSNQGSTSKPRKINVELTAGGGGKSAGRKDKIQVKNQKLNAERARDRKKEKKRLKKESGQNRTGKGNKNGVPASGANDGQVGQSTNADSNGIHPSRLNRIRA